MKIPIEIMLHEGQSAFDNAPEPIMQQLFDEPLCAKPHLGQSTSGFQNAVESASDRRPSSATEIKLNQYSSQLPVLPAYLLLAPVSTHDVKTPSGLLTFDAFAAGRVSPRDS